MLIEFIKPFGHWQVGQTIEPPDGQAELMIQRGWCKKKEEKKAAVESTNKPQKTRK